MCGMWCACVGLYVCVCTCMYVLSVCVCSYMCVCVCGVGEVERERERTGERRQMINGACVILGKHVWRESKVLDRAVTLPRNVVAAPCARYTRRSVKRRRAVRLTES